MISDILQFAVHVIMLRDVVGFVAFSSWHISQPGFCTLRLDARLAFLFMLLKLLFEKNAQKSILEK